MVRKGHAFAFRSGCQPSESVPLAARSSSLPSDIPDFGDRGLCGGGSVLRMRVAERYKTEVTPFVDNYFCCISIVVLHWRW